MVQDGVSEAMESPSLKNVKNNIINLLNLTEIMIMIIMAVSFNMCVWARNSSYLYHQNIKIYADSINSAFIDDPTFSLTEQKFSEIKESIDAEQFQQNVIQFYFVTVTLSVVGYGDAFMPPLSDYHSDYLVLFTTIFIGTLIFSIISSKLQQFMGDFKVTEDLQNHLDAIIDDLEMFLINHNNHKDLEES